MGLLQVAAINSAMSSLIKTITVRERRVCVQRGNDGDCQCSAVFLPSPLYTCPAPPSNPNHTPETTGLHQGAAHRHPRAVERERGELRPGPVLPLQDGGGAARHRALVRAMLCCVWCRCRHHSSTKGGGGLTVVLCVRMSCCIDVVIIPQPRGGGGWMISWLVDPPPFPPLSTHTKHLQPLPLRHHHVPAGGAAGTFVSCAIMI